MGKSAQTAVVGVGHSVTRRREEEPLGVLAIQACRQAIADAGLKPSDIDGICGNPDQGFEGNSQVDGISYVYPESLAHGLGMHTRWGLRINCATFLKPLATAAHAVQAGACNYALVFRAIHNPVGRYGVIDPTHIDVQGVAGMQGTFSAPYGPTPPSSAAFLAQQYMHRYGVTREDLGAFVVRNRDQALLWERGYWAQFRPERLTLEQYMAARMVSWPLCMYDCDIPIQACAAWIVTSAERARDLPHPPAYILGTSNPEAAIPNRPWLLEDFEAGARWTAKGLYESAGIGPGDYQVANVYDGFSIFPPIWVEAMGLAQPGKGVDALAKGWSECGTTALQTSSGNLGHGRMPGVAQVMDSVLQVMKRAGPRQVKDVKIAVATASVAVEGNALAFGSEPA